MFFLKTNYYPSAVYVRPVHPPILALTKGSLLPIKSPPAPNFTLISVILIVLHTTFLTVKVSIMSPKC